MKRRGLLYGTVVLICLIFIASSAFADGDKALTFRVSYFFPNDAKAGFTFGGSMGTMFDDIVELGIGTDVYVRTYEKTTKVAEQSYEAGIDTLIQEVYGYPDKVGFPVVYRPECAISSPVLRCQSRVKVNDSPFSRLDNSFL